MTVGKTVRIDSSRIKGAGRGVFALVDFKEGQKITKYEGRITPVDEPRTDEEMAYTIDYGEGFDLIGFNNRRRWEGIGAAALINDALCPALQSKVKKSPYFTRSQKRRAMNCCLQSSRSNNIYAVATRDIVAGEELYTTYGWNYWTSYFPNDKARRRHIRMHDISGIVMDGYGHFVEVPDSCYHPHVLESDALRILWKGRARQPASCPCLLSCPGGGDFSTSYVWQARILTVFCHTCHGSIQRFVE